VNDLNARGKTWLLRLLIAGAAAGAIYFVWVLLTPTFGKVVGYANEQPTLRIIQPADGRPQTEVRRVLDLAQYHFDSRPGLRQLFWPEPSAIEEKPECWLVTFTSKIPIYRFCGFSEAFRPTDPAMALTIAKQDLSARFGNWCP